MAFPRVRDHMDKHLYTLSADVKVTEALEVMLEHRVTGLPVTKKNGTIVGIITETDCLRLLAQDGTTDTIASATVGDFMSPAQALKPDMDIYYAAGVLLRTGFRRVLVEEDGKLVGAITKFDILRAINNGLKGEQKIS